MQHPVAVGADSDNAIKGCPHVVRPFKFWAIRQSIKVMSLQEILADFPIPIRKVKPARFTTVFCPFFGKPSELWITGEKISFTSRSAGLGVFPVLVYPSLSLLRRLDAKSLVDQLRKGLPSVPMIGETPAFPLLE